MRNVEQEFKAAMRRVATTIAVVTTDDAGSPVGVAVTAFASVSIDPPSLLVCINHDSTLHAPLRRRRGFCVNLLRQGQEEICRNFSGGVRIDKRFESGGWRVDETGMPYLADAQAVLFCDLAQEIPFGTHSVFIGQVWDTRVRSDVSPLLYIDGAVTSFGKASDQIGTSCG